MRLRMWGRSPCLLVLADLAPWLVTIRNTAYSTKSHRFSFDDGFHRHGYASGLSAQVRCSFHGQVPDRVSVPDIAPQVAIAVRASSRTRTHWADHVPYVFLQQRIESPQRRTLLGRCHQPTPTPLRAGYQCHYLKSCDTLRNLMGSWRQNSRP